MYSDDGHLLDYDKLLELNSEFVKARALYYVMPTFTPGHEALMANHFPVIHQPKKRGRKPKHPPMEALDKITKKLKLEGRLVVNAKEVGKQTLPAMSSTEINGISKNLTEVTASKVVSDVMQQVLYNNLRAEPKNQKNDTTFSEPDVKREEGVEFICETSTSQTHLQMTPTNLKNSLVRKVDTSVSSSPQEKRLSSSPKNLVVKRAEKHNLDEKMVEKSSNKINFVVVSAGSTSIVRINKLFFVDPTC